MAEAAQSRARAARRASLVARGRRRWVFPLGAYLASRVVVAIGVAAMGKVGGPSPSDLLIRWDGAWYLSIVRDGYASVVPAGTGVAGQANIAFFPGYPLLVRALAAVGPPDRDAAIVLAAIAGAAAVLSVWWLAETMSNAVVADRSATLFTFLPASFVLSMAYADGLFVALAALCLLALIRRAWVWAGLAAAAASAVRPTGIVLTAACVVAASRADHDRRAWVAAILAPIGFVAYMAFLWVHTGTASAFFDVERRGWQNSFDFGLTNLRTVVRDVTSARGTLFVILLAVVVGGAIVACVWLIRSHTPAEVLAYVVGVFALALLTSKPTSVPRFLLAAFPLVTPVAAKLSERAFLIVVAVSASLMLALFLLSGMGTLAP